MKKKIYSCMNRLKKIKIYQNVKLSFIYNLFFLNIINMSGRGEGT